MARADFIFRNAEIYDGTGAAPSKGDVAITGDRIVGVGALASLTADKEVDAKGKALAPGFIDVHTHDDRYLLDQPAVPAKTSQGVTSVVIGNCGFSMAPYTRAEIERDNWFVSDRSTAFPTVADYVGRLAKTPPALNVAILVGHNSLRANTMSDLGQPASDAELAAMQSQLREAMDAGAIGLSSGLFYPPGRAATTQEVTALASVMAKDDGLYTAHIRDERERVLEAIDEAAQIGRDAGVRVVISHHKTAGRANFGRTVETLALIARLQKHQELGLDVYPYIASSTVMLPDYVESADKVTITWCKGRPEFSGRDLDTVARELGLSRVEAAKAVLPAGAIYFQMSEDDVRRVMQYPGAMIGSDGLPWDSIPHPRLWGTFPRVLGHYARDEKIMSLPEAVHRMTGRPAAQFKLKDRGGIKVGAFADLVLFDKDTVIDTATFDKPEQPAAGIELVMVNGQIVWQDGRETGARAGGVLQRA
ncbi:MAG: D-aminoacylase [Rhodospirillales bacterium]